jgi:F-box/leucine-rich repeat protein 4
VLKIFKNLDLKSLSRCSQVNRHFNSIAHDTLLYTSLNLKPYWYCVDTAVLNSFISRCQYLQRLDISWCGNYNTIKSEDFIVFLQSSGSTIIHLRLNCCHFVNDAVIEEIAQTCKNLKGI